MKQISSKKSPVKKIVIVVLILLVLGSVTYFLLSKTILHPNDYGSAQTTPNTDTPAAQTDQGVGAIIADKDTKKPPSPTPVDKTTKPTTPTGTFVSNHSPSLSGGTSPSTLNSTCTTTPGVSCQISFTSGSTTLYLPAKTTDGAGNASWDWNVNDIGLSVGTWEVTATAKNGSQTATATDPLLLRVKP